MLSRFWSEISYSVMLNSTFEEAFEGKATMLSLDSIGSSGSYKIFCFFVGGVYSIAGTFWFWICSGWRIFASVGMLMSEYPSVSPIQSFFVGIDFLINSQTFLILVATNAHDLLVGELLTSHIGNSTYPQTMISVSFFFYTHLISNFHYEGIDSILANTSRAIPHFAFVIKFPIFGSLPQIIAIWTMWCMTLLDTSWNLSFLA